MLYYLLTGSLDSGLKTPGGLSDLEPCTSVYPLYLAQSLYVTDVWYMMIHLTWYFPLFFRMSIMDFVDAVT